ncbi:hypothetical protein CR513_56934, partial [Mucuna pruriens]
MLGTQLPDSNQVGQTISRPIGEVSPPKPPTELKPLPNHLKYAYLGDEQQFPNLDGGRSTPCKAITKETKPNHLGCGKERSD